MSIREDERGSGVKCVRQMEVHLISTIHAKRLHKKGTRSWQWDSLMSLINILIATCRLEAGSGFLRKRLVQTVWVIWGKVDEL